MLRQYRARKATEGHVRGRLAKIVVARRTVKHYNAFPLVRSTMTSPPTSAGALDDRNPFLVALGETVRSLRARRGMTRRALAAEAELARSAREAGENDDALPPREAAARRLDRARHLAAVDVGQAFRRRIAAVEQQHVDVVQRARSHAHHDLAGRGRRVLVVAVDDLVAAAVLLEVSRFHAR